ncbi:MAG: glycosyltransferase family 4 protein, partial [Lentisphaeraceae bacterium]|nr:glycosyltransferase family 4 protein [Lentisphaeraceae bacterium]
ANIYSMITGLGYIFTGETLRHKVLRFIISFVYCRALKINKRVFFQNPDDLNKLLELNLVQKSQAVIINGSGIDISNFKETQLPGEVRFLLIARLLRDKGVYEYIDAIKIVKEKYPDIQFDLVGWLDENPACIKSKDLERWQKTNLVNFLGKLDDVRPALEKCSVYVLPSYREGTPRTVLEAMAMGRPIITTDAPGCRETVKDQENGFLVPVKNSKVLAEKMIYFIEHPQEQIEMGKKSRCMAVQKYDVHKVNRSILEAMELM